MQTQTMNQQKLWTKYYILIMVYSLLTVTSNNMLMTGIPLYAIHLGGNNSIAGLMMGVFMITAIVFRPLFGRLLDTMGRRMVLMMGAAICILAYFSYTFAFSVAMLLLLRAFNGIGFSANTNASGTVVSDIVPRSRLSEGIGYYGVANTLATAFGPGLTLLIINTFNYQVLFFVVFGIGIMSFICSYFMKYEEKKPKSKNTLSEQDKMPPDSRPIRQKIADAIFEKTALPPSLVIVFLALAMGGIMTFIPTYAATRGIENIGVYFTVYAFSLLFTRLFVGRIADRYGESTVILPGMILMIISFIILAFATSIPMFLISGVLYGLGFGSAQPTLNSIMIKLCPAGRRGIGNSTFFTAMDLGSGGGAVIWGFVSQKAGFTPVYLSCTVSIIISLIVYICLLQKKLSREKNADAIYLHNAA